MKYRLANNAGEGQVGRLGSMMIYVIPKDGDEPIKIVFEDGKEDDEVYLIDERPSPEEVGKAFRALYERLMSF